MLTGVMFLALAAEPVSFVGFACEGFSEAECGAWSRRFAGALSQKVTLESQAAVRVSGSIVRVDEHGADVSLKLLHADGQGWVSFAERVDYKERLGRMLDTVAARFGDAVTHVPRDPKKVQLLLGVGELGLSMSILGAVLYGVSQADAAALRSSVPQTAGEVHAAAAQGRTYQPVGAVLIGVGLAVVVGALAWLIFGAQP